MITIKALKQFLAEHEVLQTWPTHRNNYQTFVQVYMNTIRIQETSQFSLFSKFSWISTGMKYLMASSTNFKKPEIIQTEIITLWYAP